MTHVYKLGGTSQCKAGYDKIAHILKTSTERNFIILSAVSGVTDSLVKFTETKDLTCVRDAIVLNHILLNELKLDKSVIKDIENKLISIAQKYIKSFDTSSIYEKSEIIGYGEILSTNIFNMYLNSLKINNKLLNSYDYIYSKKEIYQCNTQTEFYCSHELDANVNNNFILQGFIGSTPSNKNILLGRGGSDTTGALVAKALQAKSYEVWTDVDGIYTGDPRIFSDAMNVPSIDYTLCQELSAMGAKVMHPLSIKPCFDLNIPIIVKNTFTDAKGTMICDELNNDMFYAIQKKQTLFKIKSLDMWNSYGFITDIFRRFSENRIDINIITTSQFSISTTTSETNLYKLLEIKDILSNTYEVEMISDCVIFSIVKRNIKDIIAKLKFDTINPEIVHISDNNMTINFVFRDFDINKIYNFLNFSK